MSAIEAAARLLVAAHADEEALEHELDLADDPAGFDRVFKAILQARYRYNQAWEALTKAVAGETPERTVKRPATLADGLLNLDDTGGH